MQVLSRFTFVTEAQAPLGILLRNIKQLALVAQGIPGDLMIANSITD
jgi:hypothetical protein